jgi:hypothetical protein
VSCLTWPIESDSVLSHMANSKRQCLVSHGQQKATASCLTWPTESDSVLTRIVSHGQQKATVYVLVLSHMANRKRQCLVSHSQQKATVYVLVLSHIANRKRQCQVQASFTWPSTQSVLAFGAKARSALVSVVARLELHVCSLRVQGACSSATGCMHVPREHR